MAAQCLVGFEARADLRSVFMAEACAKATREPGDRGRQTLHGQPLLCEARSDGRVGGQASGRRNKPQDPRRQAVLLGERLQGSPGRRARDLVRLKEDPPEHHGPGPKALRYLDFRSLGQIRRKRHRLPRGDLGHGVCQDTPAETLERDAGRKASPLRGPTMGGDPVSRRFDAFGLAGLFDLFSGYRFFLYHFLSDYATLQL